MTFQPGQNVGSQNVRWAGDNVSVSGGRLRARRLYPGEHVCESADCGKRAERHHKDGNTKNNDASNIAFLCHRHHVEADGRMTRPALRDALRAATAGKSLSDSHRRKISAAHTGMKRSTEAREAMRLAKVLRDQRTPKPTECPRGHAYNARNTYVRKNGVRSCRACQRARAKSRWDKRKESAA